MNDHPPEVHVRDRRIPGFGHLFELPLPDGSIVSVVSQDRTDDREMHLPTPDDDEPQVRVALPGAHAETLASLLSGMRVFFDRDDQPWMGVQVTTVPISAGSPASGNRIYDIVMSPLRRPGSKDAHHRQEPASDLCRRGLAGPSHRQ